MTSSRSRQRHPRFTLDDDEHESDVETPERSRTPNAASRGGVDEPRGDAFGDHGANDEKRSTGKGAEQSGASNGSGSDPALREKREHGRYPPSTSRSPTPNQTATTAETESAPTRVDRLKKRLLAISWLAWIAPHLCWRGWRPVIRASIASWCGLILMLVPRTQRMLGQASFLVLIGGSGRSSKDFDARLTPSSARSRSERDQSRLDAYCHGTGSYCATIPIRSRESQSRGSLRPSLTVAMSRRSQGAWAWACIGCERCCTLSP